MRWEGDVCMCISVCVTACVPFASGQCIRWSVFAVEATNN